MANPVSAKWFTSAMSGATGVAGQAGSLITNVLDPCLLNGFGSVTLASLVVSSAVATATVNTGHGFLDYAVVLVEGATPSGLNGEKRITHTGTNTFTFDATGISDQTATGTITAKMAPLGWTKPHSDTNKAAYARSSLAGTAMLLRVDDTPAQYPVLKMYETMSNVDTGAGTATAIYTGKSSVSSSTARDWVVIGDDLAFYLFVKSDGSNWYSGMVFGDLIPAFDSDIYHCLLLGNTSQSYYHNALYRINAEYGKLCRSYSQIGGDVNSKRSSTSIGDNNLGYCNSVYPLPGINGLWCWSVDCWETNGNTYVAPRGVMPGLLSPTCPSSGGPAQGTIFTNISGHSGKKFLLQVLDQSFKNYALLDITGPWR